MQTPQFHKMVVYYKVAGQQIGSHWVRLHHPSNGTEERPSVFEASDKAGNVRKSRLTSHVV